jgi:hypothetical protein
VPETVFGLPIHPLIVHATVVAVPVAALTLLLSAVWPRYRRWAGPLTPALALVALALVPLTTESGENLEGQVGETPLVARHQELADMMLPWMVAVTVLAVVGYWLHRRALLSGERGQPRWLTAGVAALSVVAFAGTTVQVVLVGHSGAEAAWHGVASQSSASGSGSASDDD